MPVPKLLLRLRSPRDEQGFALILVLWIAGLLAVLAGGLSTSVQTQLRVAANTLESARAEALADGGVAIAVLDLLTAHGSTEYVRRFPIDGNPIACSVAGEGMLLISVADEAGRIDVNAAGIPILRALLVGLGEPPQKAAQLADAIFDFRDGDGDRKPNGAEDAEYRAAGLAWPPKNAPLHSADELEQVFGMPPDLTARVRPFLSTHSGLPGIDPSIARPELIAILRRGLEGAQSSFGGFAEFDAKVALPAIFMSVSEKRYFELTITARTTSGAVFVREAVVDLGSPRSPKTIFRRWTRGAERAVIAISRLTEKPVSSC
jgi:general secretion pathway protein K